MPNLDGGHYFLTALLPVLSDPVARADGTITSPSHALREALASLPTAAQSEACIVSNRHSPFGRCRHTHFARLVVLDQPAFNGRDPGDTLVQALKKSDLLAHQPVDCLATPWLMVIIDFDPQSGPDPLAAYLRNLWTVMEPELRAVFRYCHGFDTVASADVFAAYIIRGQVETTMPFNDYWTEAPPFPSLELPALGAMALAFFAGALVVEWVIQNALGGIGKWLWFGIPIALLLTIWFALGTVRRRGAKPFPTAPGSDLPTILKALFLQQHFASFAATHQGMEAHDLHREFGRFLNDVQPENTEAPTREPGVIPQ